MLGLFGGGAIAYLGSFGGFMSAGLGAILTPLFYLDLKSTPGYDFGLYNHEIGRAVRERFSNSQE